LRELAEVGFAGQIDAQRQGHRLLAAQRGGTDGDVVLRGEPAEHRADRCEHRHQRADPPLPAEREHRFAEACVHLVHERRRTGRCFGPGPVGRQDQWLGAAQGGLPVVDGGALPGSVGLGLFGVGGLGRGSGRLVQDGGGAR
jgi:hypothetical protein